MKIEVYILVSSKLGIYYVGYTKDLTNRIEMHQNGTFQDSFTSKAKDWELFYCIECESIVQARRIEKHIKRMKSKKYIENLPKYSEISFKLLQKYK
ncbi:GIY-YIG nuclease family protein [Marinifilum sp. RC60d5]|uniref:GIY-YIG nuclease family protein n=1 Tax=Marinifilum sp. RC60d5 TaxID=3458414 RepID=UPI004035E3CC